MQKSITKSPQETQYMAAELAQQILHKELGKEAVVLALRGDLGAGKTTFVQGFAKGLGIKEKILSPTFVILKKFKIPSIPQNQRSQSSWYRYFYHVDCYRLNIEEEVLQLGFKEIISKPENIVAIEWPERIKNILPKNAIHIDFIHRKSTGRALHIDGLGL